MDFDTLVREFGYLGILMREIHTDDEGNTTFTIRINVCDDWCFLAYGNIEETVLLDAAEALQSWLV